MEANQIRMTATGVDGEVRLLGDRVLIQPKGIGSSTRVGKEIPVSHISSIEYHNASLTHNGHIRFLLHGGTEKKMGLVAKIKEGNMVRYQKGKQRDFDALKTALEKMMVADARVKSGLPQPSMFQSSDQTPPAPQTEELSALSACSSCGSSVDSDDAYCSNCGSPRSESSDNALLVPNKAVTRQVALPCPQCKAWSDLAADATEWTCPRCNKYSRFKRCSTCGGSVQTGMETRWVCPWCRTTTKETFLYPQVTSTALMIQEAMVRRGIYNRDSAKNYLRDFTLIAVQGYDVPAGTPCTITVLSDDCVITPTDTRYLPVRCAAEDIISIEVGGPGAVRKGGGFIGGGFGLVGAAGGMAAAAALNKLTTKTSINNLLQIVTRTSSFVLLNSTYNPGSLKLAFTPLQNRLLQLQVEKKEELAALPNLAPDVDKYEQLRKLGELREAGILTDDEFQTEKAKLLES